MVIVPVRGGICIKADVFTADYGLEIEDFALAIADPPYGKILSGVKWDQISANDLARKLQHLFWELETLALPGAHFWLWGGIGTPDNRALYQALMDIEAGTSWKCAEQITWRKKRGYGTQWRCLMNREECLRFVLGDIRKPRVYYPQLTTDLRGYAGFNKKHPAKSEYKRQTMVWDHASDMGQNKPHQCHKPRPLAVSQIAATTNSGDLVLDLFAGSAEVSLTARDMERRFVAIEFGDTEFDSMVARLSA